MLAAWTARVDGATAPHWRANFAYLAVPVGPGRHDVRLDYRPRGLTAGSILSVAGLGGVALALARSRRTRGNWRAANFPPLED